VTYPLNPAAQLDLAPAVRAAIPDAATMRIGRVTRYDAGFITVAISDSDVLVDASYLFPSYQPVLGDTVAVVKQGNQWLALGALSANPDDNVVANHSFENGEYDVMAPNWTLYHDPASTEVAAVDVSFAAVEIDGPKMLRIGIGGTVVGAISSSTDYVSSDPFLVTPGDRWAASAWVTGSSLSAGPWVRGSAAAFFSFYSSDSATYPNTAAPDAGIRAVNIPTTQTWILVRSMSGTVGVEIPEGVSYARITLRTILTHEDTTSNYSFAAYWDRVIARRL
jgi:hypothetical protein